MEFLRKYKVLAVGGVIALILLSVAGVFLFLNIRKYVADTDEADANQSRLTDLQNRKPAGPIETNVLITASNAAIKEACLTRLLAHLRQGQVEPRHGMQKVVFNSFLKTTIDQMNEAAKQQGMTVPPKFDYGFKTYYSEGKLPANNIDVPRLTVQVQLVKALTDMMQKAHIAEVLSIERQVFEEGAATAVAGTPAPARGEGRMVTPAAGATTASTSPYALEPPEAQGLYTREHFTLSLKSTDERLAALMNILAHNLENAQPRLFAVVTKLEITGAGLSKPGAQEVEAGARGERVPVAVVAHVAEGAGATGVPDKPAPPKKRAERVVAGMDNVTVLLDVDIYRFAADSKEKAKP